VTRTAIPVLVELKRAADTRLRRELATIVEFLNEQMKADVRAIELNWCEDERGITTLVRRTLGETERALAQKSVARTLLPAIGMTSGSRNSFRFKEC